MNKKERTIALWGHVKNSVIRVGIKDAFITLMREDSTTTMTFAAEDMDFAIVPRPPERRSSGLGTAFHRPQTKVNGYCEVVAVVDFFRFHHLIYHF